MTIFQYFFVVVFVGSFVPLIISSIIGISIGLVQSAFQLQEQATTLLFKIAVIGIAAFLGGNWLIRNCSRILVLSLELEGK